MKDVVALRNAVLDARTAQYGNAAKLQLWSGTVPTLPTDTPAGALLAELTCGTPFAPAASGGVLTGNTVTGANGLPAAGAGTAATFARILTSGSVAKSQLTVSVSGGGGEVQLAGTTNIVDGQPVSVTSISITAAGA